ncbi:hypothetical protein E4582_10065 [Luteimonas yindakuii]|uniref:Uncharacterized protein n=1 Tax=Luteimonas yindakuii TaxID=2565782 RepID=A0A4Z1RN13_9GAMM|nr:hypothetical protein [Luteimonas yindakuii]TKS55071.1 hypothetical protein E4582_10065 [Luteimonas yindakuii]
MATTASAAVARPLADALAATAPRPGAPGAATPGSLITGAGMAQVAGAMAAAGPAGGSAAGLAGLQGAPAAAASAIPRGMPAMTAPATLAAIGTTAHPGALAGNATGAAGAAGATALHGAAAQGVPLASGTLAPSLRGDLALPGVLRADAALVGERAGSLAPAGMPAQAPGTTAAASAGATIAMANAPPVQSMPTMPAVVPPSQSPADVRGNPLAGGGERGGTRVDGAPIAHGHTVASGDGRRARRDRFTTLLAAVGAGSDAARRELAEIRKAELAYQWLYWVLTIVAFASFGILLVALLPWGEGVALVSRGVREPVSMGILVTLGLTSAAGAWAMARTALSRKTPGSAGER